MTTLNAAAAEAALAVGPSAMTDVTGFGLLGHLHELALAERGRGARRGGRRAGDRGRARAARARARVAGGSRRNRECVEPHVRWDDAVAERAGAAVRRHDLRRAAGRGRARSGAARDGERARLRRPAGRVAARDAMPGGGIGSDRVVRLGRASGSGQCRRQRGRPRRPRAARPTRRRSSSSSGIAAEHARRSPPRRTGRSRGPHRRAGRAGRAPARRTAVRARRRFRPSRRGSRPPRSPGTCRPRRRPGRRPARPAARSGARGWCRRSRSRRPTANR